MVLARSSVKEQDGSRQERQDGQEGQGFLFDRLDCLGRLERPAGRREGQASLSAICSSRMSVVVRSVGLNSQEKSSGVLGLLHGELDKSRTVLVLNDLVCMCVLKDMHIAVMHG